MADIVAELSCTDIKADVRDEWPDELSAVDYTSKSAYSVAVPDKSVSARQHMIYGKSVKWNQMFDFNGCTTSDDLNTVGGAYTCAGSMVYTRSGELEITLSGTTETGLSAGVVFDVSIPSGHVVLIRGIADGAKSGKGHYMRIGWSDGYNNIDTNGLYTLANDVTYAAIRVSSNITLENVVYSPQIVDMTVMFGAGNEPTSLDDSRIIELGSYVSGLEKGTFIDADVIAVEIASADGTVTGSDAVPDAIRNLPMYGAGFTPTAYRNVVDYVAKTYKQYTGGVDLGTLNWTYDGTIALFKAPFTGMRSAGSSLAAYLVAGNDYVSDTYTNITSHTTDKTIGFRNNNIVVYDTSYGEDADAFKTAMSGIEIRYRLIESLCVTTDISEYLRGDCLSYQSCESGGNITYKQAGGSQLSIQSSLYLIESGG